MKWLSDHAGYLYAGLFLGMGLIDLLVFGRPWMLVVDVLIALLFVYGFHCPRSSFYLGRDVPEADGDRVIEVTPERTVTVNEARGSVDVDYKKSSVEPIETPDDDVTPHDPTTCQVCTKALREGSE